ncbi:MAG: NRDE family protein [Streptosporangiaceae bacterium]
MCIAILGLEPDGTVLLAGVRDEVTSRAWQPPARHWPDRPGVIGGRDLQAGGTWLAVAPDAPRVACVLNGRGRMAPAPARRTRGELPLSAAADGKLAPTDLAGLDPFRLLVAEPGRALLSSWNGDQLTERDLGPGLHMLVNGGLAGDLLSARAGAPSAVPGDSGPGGLTAGQAADARALELARIGYFLPRLRAARRPHPEPGVPVAAAWGDWLPLVNGGGIGPDDQRALIVLRDLGEGRFWGTTSVSLVAISPEGIRYDFTGNPGGAAAWSPVALDERSQAVD